MTTINHKTFSNANIHKLCPDGLLADRPVSPINAYNNFYYAKDVNKIFAYFNGLWLDASIDKNPGDILPDGSTNFKLANNATDATNDIDIYPGYTTASSGDAAIILPALITKRLDATWSAGTNKGGLDTGSKANSTWYHVFVIGNPTTGAVDVIFSTSLTPTLPSGYTKFRRIGSIYVQSTGIILPIYQVGKEFRHATPATAATTTTTSSRAITLSAIPLGISVIAKGRCRLQSITGLTNTLYACNCDGIRGSAYTPSSALADLVSVNNVSELYVIWDTQDYYLITNTSGQIYTNASAAGATINWESQAWIDYTL